jgi:DNA topoisomerase-1
MPHLLIVESPGKLKTLRKILGAGWLLEASVGHTTELASDGTKRLGFDLGSDAVATRYVPRGSRGRQVLNKLRQAARQADRVYLATDPDREGEAIAWHLVQQLGLRDYCRVTYTQITEAAVRKAVLNPGTLDLALVDAQRARQCLDKLVGFEVSPLLWHSTGGKSAGRVQSSTLHLICERERERLAFRPERYWTLKSRYSEGLEALYEPPAEIARPGEEPPPPRVRSEAEAKRIEAIARSQPHIVQSQEAKEERRNPPPPLITSSLQQMAGARFKYAPKKTMQIAQQLYEGIEGKGLITYMRTDAVVLSPEFVAEARKWLQANAPKAMAERPPFFRAKEGAQAAHEAIRPTYAQLTPEEAEPLLSREQFNIYTLIWERAMASQCKPARLSRDQVVIACADTRWIARGMRVLDPGYLRFWKNTEEEKELPRLRPGQKLGFREVEVDSRVTEPPSRYTEPKLVQLMEKKGIGRPSTYASTIATLKDRDYAALEKNFLAPTPLGMATDEALTKALPDLVDTDFTAKMESALDDIAEGKLPWQRYLIDWNRDYLAPALVTARQVMSTIERVPGLAAKKSKYPMRDPAKLAAATEKARAQGAVPICAAGHGELKLQPTKKGGVYWKCGKKGCKEFAFHQELASEKCPACAEPMAKIKSRKVVGGYFLKCSRKEKHASAAGPGEEVVLFRNRATKVWERAGTRVKTPYSPGKGRKPRASRPRSRRASRPTSPP